ncbi:hypothetical protein RchiOBHm_Chr7g0210431 [Rosa chinensis]|uniref:Uncharacterized protein n=1 Tax=Rosa chinensis TaxID=74649 RepID=A0A2P6PA70_ROSCH|nr:hypothetical protein RchiOBHm_Chr7g0210431 [Rosa chinensis]
MFGLWAYVVLIGLCWWAGYIVYLFSVVYLTFVYFMYNKSVPPLDRDMWALSR